MNISLPYGNQPRAMDVDKNVHKRHEIIQEDHGVNTNC